MSNEIQAYFFSLLQRKSFYLFFEGKAFKFLISDIYIYIFNYYLILFLFFLFLPVLFWGGEGVKFN